MMLMSLVRCWKVVSGALFIGVLTLNGVGASPFLTVKVNDFANRAELPIVNVKLSNEQIRRLLRAAGFSNITDIARGRRKYTAVACKDGVRYGLRLSRFGAVRKAVNVGPCRPHDRRRIDHGGLRDPGYRHNNRPNRRNRHVKRPPEVRQVLRTRGFSRILFLDHQLPVYVVEACRHDRKFELRLNRFARIMRKTNLGRCRTEHLKRGYGPRKVENILHRRGYRKIDFFDRSLPGYGLTACKRGQKFRMRLNRFAEIKRRRRTGFCRPPRTVQRDVNDYEEIDDKEIDATGKIDPETCQTYLDTLVRRNRIHFDVASANLRRRSHRLLRRLARVMNRCRSSKIEIAGHTDSDGSRELNHDLSHDRAHSVARYLYSEGISRRRISANGYGEDQPLMRYERTERDKARNRRIEFTVIWGDDDRNYR